MGIIPWSTTRSHIYCPTTSKQIIMKVYILLAAVAAVVSAEVTKSEVVIGKLKLVLNLVTPQCTLLVLPDSNNNLLTNQETKIIQILKELVLVLSNTLIVNSLLLSN